MAASAVVLAAVIEGEITFPGQNVPSMTAYACETETLRVRTLPIAQDQSKFSFEVPPGHYVVFLAPNEPGAPNIYGAYTQYSVCAARAEGDHADGAQPLDANCPDHHLVTLTLATRVSRAAVNVDDWYLTDDVAEQLDHIRGIEARAAGEPLGAPRFSEYKAAPYETTLVPKPDFTGIALAADDRSKLQQALAAAPNFAGSVSVLLTRCGNACDHLVLLDWRSGKILEPPALNEIQGGLPCRAEEAVLFRRDSRLLAVTRMRGEAIVTQYFLWKDENNTLAFATEYERRIPQFCAAMPP